MDQSGVNLLISYESVLEAKIDHKHMRMAQLAWSSSRMKSSYRPSHQIASLVARQMGTKLMHAHHRLKHSDELSIGSSHILPKTGSLFRSGSTFDENLASVDGQCVKLKPIVQRGLAVGKYSIHICFIEPPSQQVKLRAGIDIGFDLVRGSERDLAFKLKQAIKKNRPEISINLNMPHLTKIGGSDDYLRQSFSDSEYLGLKIMVSPLLFSEIGINQVFDLLFSGIKSAMNLPVDVRKLDKV